MLSSQRDLVQCPSCSARLPYSRLNSHLDRCLQDAGPSHHPSHPPPPPPSIATSPSSPSTNVVDGSGVFETMMMGGKKRKVPAAGVPSATPGPRDDLPPGQDTKKVRSSPPLKPTTPNGQSGVAHHRQTTSPTRDIKENPLHPHHPSSRDHVASAAPLAERLRPRSLEEYVGQEDIVKGPLAALLRQGRIPSCILWGPPGVGKTTLARLLTKEVNDRWHLKMMAKGSTIAAQGSTMPPYRFIELSATNTSTVDLKKIFATSLSHLQLTGQRTILFMDEIQRYSRAQQDVFLGPVERGHVVLVAATTENPSFRLQGALLSRMRVFVLKKLTSDEVLRLLVAAKDRVAMEEGRPESKVEGIKVEAQGGDIDVAKQESGAEDSDSNHMDPMSTSAPAAQDGVPHSILSYIANSCEGDARAALQSLEIAISVYEPTLSASENLSNLKSTLSRQAFHYDRTGDEHYDTISALHKSIRGSDPDASLYWLARMVAAGDDPLFIARRLIVAASEDIDTLPALQLAVATYQACQVVGLPECGENLAQCVIALAESPKSTRSYRAWKKALHCVETEEQYPVPLHIRNAPTKLMKSLGYGREYRYEPRFAHPVYQRFFPEEMGEERRFLSPPPSLSPSVEEVGEGGEWIEGSRDRIGVGDTMMASDYSLADTTTAAPADRPAKKILPPRGHFRQQSPTPEEASPSNPIYLPTSSGIGPGACQRLFSLNSRIVDFTLLDEWQRLRNQGKEWGGRRRLERLVWSGGGGGGGAGGVREIFDLDDDGEGDGDGEAVDEEEKEED